MARTGRLGGSNSQAGELILAYGARRRPGFRRSSRSPHYRVQAFELADTTTYGIGDLIAEFNYVKNIGWADYMNDVPQSFFTVNQDDPKVKLLRDYKGKSHVRLYRNDDLVWAGMGAMEIDGNATDAIFYNYGYLASLFWAHTDWNQEWDGKTVKEIVSDSWTRAKTTLTHSRVGFVSTGTIESPVTTAGGSTAITLPLYSAFYKRILFLLQEMAALGASDTSHTTMFEITHSTSPTFNFWKDRARTLTDVRWEWQGGRGKLRDFGAYEMPVFHRNDVLGVGSIPRNTLARKEVDDSTDITTYGRMQESLFFPWVRDETELERVLNLRAAKALRDVPDLALSFHAGAETPPGTAQSKWRIGDKVPVKIDRGITNIDQTMQITGVQVLAINGQEYVRAMIQEPV